MVRIKAKKILVAAILAMVTASIGGCYYPYRRTFDYDYHRRDDYRRYDRYDGNRDYGYRDYDHDGR